MDKIEKIHQQVRSALIRGRVLSPQESQQALELITTVDAQIEFAILEMESACENLQQGAACLIQPKVFALLKQHLILSDLIFWLKQNVAGGCQWQDPDEKS